MSEIFTPELLGKRLIALPTHVVYGQVVGQENWGDGMFRLVPEHMRESVVWWVAFGVYGGGFFTSMIEGDFYQMMRSADVCNERSLPDWAGFWFNYAPAGCFGEGALSRWKGIYSGVED